MYKLNPRHDVHPWKNLALISLRFCGHGVVEWDADEEKKMKMKRSFRGEAEQ